MHGVALLLLVVPGGAWQQPGVWKTTRQRGVRARSQPEVKEPEVKEIPRNVAAEFQESDELPEELTEKQKEIARLKAAEKFIEQETGVYICKVCAYKYDPEVGQPIAQIPAGTQFSELPATWRCPTCRATKDAFEPVTLEIAGFAENQNFGLGGNSMTSDSKNALIFGSLGAFFALFMAGYLLN
ncbi:hypothetical protein CTAYLR_004408 [Chrysophaeum taylorii]|uniref:Rubredoxin-like domain-containing protein n=1 Tax=Chrysophaeum taylorii TaxID=2483200 RepID=A0AAD7UM25_9STRA|nr:hypothetical protein CTAYLR_004408 [Chrysophaeum taylorii]